MPEIKLKFKSFPMGRGMIVLFVEPEAPHSGPYMFKGDRRQTGYYIRTMQKLGLYAALNKMKHLELTKAFQF